MLSFLDGCETLQVLLSIFMLCVQFVPQVITTLRLRRVGSLSIRAMCMQVRDYFFWGCVTRAVFSFRLGAVVGSQRPAGSSS